MLMYWDVDQMRHIHEEEAHQYEELESCSSSVEIGRLAGGQILDSDNIEGLEWGVRK